MTGFDKLEIYFKDNKNQTKTDGPRCSVKNSLSVSKGLGLYNCYSCGFKGKINKYDRR